MGPKAQGGEGEPQHTGEPPEPKGWRGPAATAVERSVHNPRRQTGRHEPTHRCILSGSDSQRRTAGHPGEHQSRLPSHLGIRKRPPGTKDVGRYDTNTICRMHAEHPQITTAETNAHSERHPMRDIQFPGKENGCNATTCPLGVTSQL